MSPHSPDLDPLGQLLAERDIRQLLGLYPKLADDGDSSSFAALFAPDGVLRVGAETITGRAAIAEWLTSTSIAGPLRHIMTNAHIVVTSASKAYGSMDMILLRKLGTDWTVGATPRYEDQYVKAEDGWRFAERALTFR